jgi:hypothetical protein
MPTILQIAGWRLFFYSDEGNEPVHIHAEKADKDCKYWLRVEEYEIEEVFGYNISPTDRREIRRIIFAHFDYIVAEWNRYFKK